MRHDRLNHAWQGDMLKNLTDFFKRQHVTADPEICNIICQDLPKKQHKAHRPAVLNLFQKPIGEKHALKKYDQFVLNTSYFGEVPDQILPQLCNFMKFLLQK